MKIAFIGAQGVGKTTLSFELATAIKKEFHSAYLISEVIRDCPLPVNMEMVPNTQIWAAATQIKREIEGSLKAKYLVCDRSVIDCYVYYLMKYRPNEAFLNFVRSWAETYDFLFYVHPKTFKDSHLIEDGFRTTDKDLQTAVDSKFRASLSLFNVRTFSFVSIDNCLDLIRLKA